MFKDITLSSDIARGFSSWSKAIYDQESPAVDLIPVVITNGAWPSTVLGADASGMECILPGEAEAAWSLFRVYYLGKYSGRRLTYLPHLGSTEVTTRLNGKDYHSTMSAYAMCILMLYNDTDSLSHRDIKATTNIPDNHLKTTLASLIAPVSLPPPATSKKGTVKKERLGPSLLILHVESSQASDGSSSETTSVKSDRDGPPDPPKPEDRVYTLNKSFVCNAKRFKIKLAPSERATQREDASSATEDRVKKEREWQIDALIVRIMKSRRKLHHNVLVQEVIAQSASRFIPSLMLIKNRIHNLIEREFVSRSSDDMNTYIYIE